MAGIGLSEKWEELTGRYVLQCPKGRQLSFKPSPVCGAVGEPLSPPPSREDVEAGGGQRFPPGGDRRALCSPRQWNVKWEIVIFTLFPR